MEDEPAGIELGVVGSVTLGVYDQNHLRSEATPTSISVDEESIAHLCQDQSPQ